MTASNHKPDCSCPVCQLRRNKPDRGDSPQLSVRLAPAIKEVILKAPGGARAYLERLVTEDQSSTGNKAMRQELERLQHKLERVEKALQSKEKLIDDAEHHRSARRSMQDTLKLREAENRRYKSLLNLTRSRHRYLVEVVLRLIYADESDFHLGFAQTAATMSLRAANHLDTDPPATLAEKKLIGADVGAEIQ